MLKPAIALCISLAVPSAAVFADDELTQELHGNTYQASPGAVNCADNLCTLTFEATQHINTVITNINCNFVVTAGAQVNRAALYTKNNAFQSVSVPVSFLGNNGSSYTFLVINSQVNYFVKQNDMPIFQLEVVAGTLFSPTCLISGYHS